MLYLLNAAKMLFPFLTFPYLTRVLSVDGYALLVYVKATIGYMYTLTDFGFTLYATRKIVEAKEDVGQMGRIVSNIICAQLLLAMLGAVILGALIFTLPLLRQNPLFVLLSFIPVPLSCFIVDYLFRGLEKMHEITIRFATMKGISTALTFVFVHSDKDLILIPILDIMSTLVAVILVQVQLKKYHIRLFWPHLTKAFVYIRQAFEYFISCIATTAFGALNTLLIGIFLPPTDVAVWAVALQLIAAIQMCYSPIVDAIYPEMIRHKRLSLIRKVLLLIMPLVISGCVLLYFQSGFFITLIAGRKYADAASLFQWLIPVLLFAFPAQICGWPALGSIGKIKSTSFSTILAALTQCAGLGLLLWCHSFTLLSIAVIRNITEGVLLASRAILVIKYRRKFN